MSPRFYWFLWLAYAVAASFLWLGGVFTMMTVVVFGFIAFGLVFTGMICVLPGVCSVAHQPQPKRSAALQPVVATPAEKGYAVLKSA